MLEMAARAGLANNSTLVISRGVRGMKGLPEDS
jgi:hypothetical protein